MIGLLSQTCTAYQLKETKTVFGRPVGEGLELEEIKSGLKCRLDFTFLFGSRVERVTEEYVERTHGVLFVKENVLKARNVIVMDDPAYNSDQYEVEFVQPVVGFNKVQHFEVVVRRRDNPYALPVPLEEEP